MRSSAYDGTAQAEEVDIAAVSARATGDASRRTVTVQADEKKRGDPALTNY